jgi:hypothetical protein
MLPWLDNADLLFVYVMGCEIDKNDTLWISGRFRDDDPKMLVVLAASPTRRSRPECVTGIHFVPANMSSK